jgi:hypothetical protein
MAWNGRASRVTETGSSAGGVEQSRRGQTKPPQTQGGVHQLARRIFVHPDPCRAGPCPRAAPPMPQYRPARQRRFLRAHKKPGTQAHRLSPHTGPPPRMLSRLSITAPHHPARAALGPGACRHCRRRLACGVHSTPAHPASPRSYPCCLRGRAAPQPLMPPLPVTKPVSALPGRARRAVCAGGTARAPARRVVSTGRPLQFGSTGSGGSKPQTPPCGPCAPATQSWPNPALARRAAAHACARLYLVRVLDLHVAAAASLARLVRVLVLRSSRASLRQRPHGPYLLEAAIEAAPCAAGPVPNADTVSADMQQHGAAVHSVCTTAASSCAGRVLAVRPGSAPPVRPAHAGDQGGEFQQQLAASSHASLPPDHPCTAKGCATLTQPGVGFEHQALPKAPRMPATRSNHRTDHTHHSSKDPRSL